MDSNDFGPNNFLDKFNFEHIRRAQSVCVGRLCAVVAAEWAHGQEVSFLLLRECGCGCVRVFVCHCVLYSMAADIGCVNGGNVRVEQYWTQTYDDEARTSGNRIIVLAMCLDNERCTSEYGRPCRRRVRVGGRRSVVHVVVRSI